jgi:hypothetical protein
VGNENKVAVIKNMRNAGKEGDVQLVQMQKSQAKVDGSFVPGEKKMDGMVGVALATGNSSLSVLAPPKSSRRLKKSRNLLRWAIRGSLSANAPLICHQRRLEAAVKPRMWSPSTILHNLGGHDNLRTRIRPTGR